MTPCRGRGMAFGMDQRIRKLDLQPDLFVPALRAPSHAFKQAQRLGELFGRFLERRPRERPPPGFGRERSCLFGQPGLHEVARDDFGLPSGDVGEFLLERFADARVQRVAGISQQRAVGRVLHQGVIE